MLETLQVLNSVRSTGHLRLFTTLLIGHKEHLGDQRILCWPFASLQMRTANRQDFVFVRPPGISHGGFQLRTDNVWYCKVLFLFSFVSRHDVALRRHDCAFVSVLEEYKGSRRPTWLDKANTKMIYERRENKLVLYVVPVSSILGKLPVVPVGDSGTLPYVMRRETADIPGAACDSKDGAGDGSRWWYVNTWALTWSTKI